VAGQTAQVRATKKVTTEEMLRSPHFYLLYVMLLMADGRIAGDGAGGPVATSFGLPLRH